MGRWYILPKHNARKLEVALQCGYNKLQYYYKRGTLLGITLIRLSICSLLFLNYATLCTIVNYSNENFSGSPTPVCRFIACFMCEAPHVSFVMFKNCVYIHKIIFNGITYLYVLIVEFLHLLDDQISLLIFFAGPLTYKSHFYEVFRSPLIVTKFIYSYSCQSCSLTSYPNQLIFSHG